MNLATPGLLPLTDPRWAAYANWELSIQTPPEPRFGNPRKGYSNGDGNTEADARTGMLGTALYPTNPALAENLMWAWQQSNTSATLTEDSLFVTTLAVIDPTIPAVAPQMGSTNIPGYHSVERHNFGTPQRNRAVVYQRRILPSGRAPPFRRRPGIDLCSLGAAGDRLERQSVLARDAGTLHAQFDCLRQRAVPFLECG